MSLPDEEEEVEWDNETDGEDPGEEHDREDPEILEDLPEYDGARLGRWASIPLFRLDDPESGVLAYRRSGLAVALVGPKGAGKTSMLLSAAHAYAKRPFIERAQILSPSDRMTQTFRGANICHPAYMHDLRYTPEQEAKIRAAREKNQTPKVKDPAMAWMDRWVASVDGSAVYRADNRMNIAPQLVIWDDTGSVERLLMGRQKQIQWVVTMIRHYRTHLWISLQFMSQMGKSLRLGLDWVFILRESHAAALDDIYKEFFKGKLSPASFLDLINRTCIPGESCLLYDMRNGGILYRVELENDLPPLARPLGSDEWNRWGEIRWRERERGRGEGLARMYEWT